MIHQYYKKSLKIYIFHELGYYTKKVIQLKHVLKVNNKFQSYETKFN